MNALRLAREVPDPAQSLIQAIAAVDIYVKAFVADPSKHIFFVRQARCKALKEDKGLVLWQLSSLLENHAFVDKALLTVLESLGGDCRAGTAPPCPLERNLQKRADVLNVRLGKGKGGGKGKGSEENEQY